MHSFCRTRQQTAWVGSARAMPPPSSGGNKLSMSTRVHTPPGTLTPPAGVEQHSGAYNNKEAALASQHQWQASAQSRARKVSVKPRAPPGSHRRPAHPGRVLVPPPLAAAALAAAAAACCQTCCCSLQNGGMGRALGERAGGRRAAVQGPCGRFRAAQTIPSRSPPVMCATEAMLGPWRPQGAERATAQSRAGCRLPAAAATALLRPTRGRRSAGCAAAACILLCCALGACRCAQTT